MVSPTAGTFTCSALQKVQARIDKVWLDNQQSADYIPEVEIINALRKEQTARLKEIEDPEKDITLKIYWVQDCNTGVEDDDGDDCDFTGPEAETKCKEYALDIKKMVKFSVKENLGRTNEIGREEALAVEFMARFKELDEMVAQTAVTKLNAFAGVNQFTGGIGEVDGITTYIKASYWSGDLYGYFAQVVIMNKLRNPFIIHGSNLFQQNWNAQFNKLNDNSKDQAPKLLSIRSYWDMFNIDAINAPDSVSYLITKGAIAIANKAYYPLNKPTTYLTDKPSIRWSVESKSIPGFYYDIIYRSVCSDEDVIHYYKFKVKFGIYQNPFGCNEEKTGVLKLVCGTAPTS